jgi:hypothetical protein
MHSQTFSIFDIVRIFDSFFPVVERADPSAPDPPDPAERCWSNVTK